MRHLLSKICLLAIVAIGGYLPLTAQPMVSNDNEDEVYKVDEHAARAYRDGQVIVKFKDASPVNIKKVNGMFKTTSVNAIDQVMTELGISDAEPLMPLTGKVAGTPRRAKALNGKTVVEPNLDNLFCLSFESDTLSVEDVVETLGQLEEVEYAEPNYLAFIQSTGEAQTYRSEPLYSQQWGLRAINLPQLWAQEKTDETRPVIAILDTGVDINHPDLAANIWTNEREADGADYEDDDNNGFVDDLHGWDFIAGTAIIGNGMDRNGHGTHCAGIAAAVGDNNIGITGANPDALILPIKVMNDDGTGDIATICRGIDYAIACGANVLSMSFGGSASAAEYQALSKALTHYTVMVGAAGNSGCNINYYNPLIPSPIFPGAYDIVLGVMASNSLNTLASFSNYDPDGPFFSKYNMDKAFSSDITWNDEAMWNYDVMAPGVGILSTYLNGSYRLLSGTSMATPMVAGAVSRILQVKGYDYARDYGLMGDLAMAVVPGTLVFDANQAASYDENNRQVALVLTALEIDDSEGDGDGRCDAGETISIYPTVRSLWGQAQNIKIRIEPYDENVPTDALEILDNNVDFGWTLNSRGSMKSKYPIRFKVNENANDGLHLPYKIIVTSDNLVQGVVQEHVFDVENRKEISGIISEDLIIFPNKYVITNPSVIQEGVTLTIMPGATIELRNELIVKGLLKCNGTPNNMIVFERPENSNSTQYYPGRVSITGNINPEISYCVWNNIQLSFSNSSVRESSPLNNCIFKNYNDVYYIGGNLQNCNVFKCNDRMPVGTINCNYINNTALEINNDKLNEIENSNILNNTKWNVWTWDGPGSSYHLNRPIYWGSNNKEIIKNSNFIDNTIDPNNLYLLIIDDFLPRPNAEAHGIVWKVVVDGYDAQDDFDLLPPLGVGRHEFKVYFNRPEMDETSTPTITMGLRSPYTQTVIAEDGAWSQDDNAAVYTAYLTITGKSNCDGLNRICVTGAKDDEFFDVPEENTRFNVLVQAAGSMATGFAAEAGLGKVDLTWNNENNDFEDAMGFNVYRFQLSEANDTINKVRLNETILDVEATEYTDYEVTPGNTYYYYYKVLSTDLKEYDISNVVAATPLTSTLGDANGSGDVDVADVITTVNYAAGMEPKPFIFEAADVNTDQDINILDVIGIIRLITNPNAVTTAATDEVATYFVKDGVVYVNSPVALAGVQVTLNADRNANITTDTALKGFEQVSAWTGDNDYLFLAYNMAGRTLAAGETALLHVGDAAVADIRLSDAAGHNVAAVPGTMTIIDEVDANLESKIAASGIYDLTGRKVASTAKELSRLVPGIYIVDGIKVVKK